MNITSADADNIRTMTQMRDRCPVENAVYAFAALSRDDKIAAVQRFNNIFGSEDRSTWTQLSIKLSALTQEPTK